MLLTSKDPGIKRTLQKFPKSKLIKRLIPYEPWLRVTVRIFHKSMVKIAPCIPAARNIAYNVLKNIAFLLVG